MRTILLAGAAALATLPLSMAGAQSTDAQIDKVIAEGLSHSEAMANASELMDGIGPRLSHSENLEKAQAWAIAKFSGYGLSNVHKEPFRFGMAWNLDSWSASMVSPRPLVMRAIPVAWSPATSGMLRAPVILAPMSKKEHFDAWRGKLAGKIVMVSLPGTGSEPDKAAFRRLEAADIAKKDHFDLPADEDDEDARFVKRVLFAKELSEFLKSEGAVGMVRISYRDGGLVHGEGYNLSPDQGLALPFMELAAEDYRRLARLEVTGKAPTIEMAIAARFDRSNLNDTNVIADIPGRDPKAGYVMAGGHFDSWIAADGASDNGAGSVVVMEAARILAKMPRPRRTIRFALWSGEEQGLLGSIAYIEQHMATRGLDPNVAGLDRMAQWTAAWPITTKPGYSEMKAYFNLDNGSGKIRGIYGEGNIAAIPTLQKWLKPFASMGATDVVAGRTGGTDHQYMQAVGLPAYQFVQDPLDYGSRVHHSSIDTVDHMKVDDIRQAATIMAGMLWQAANSETELPRPPLPLKPGKADPFKVQDPDEK